MTLIKSISGIRGTIGGPSGDNLTPQDIVECTAGYGAWLKGKKSNCTVVIGRDGRASGSMVSSLVSQTLIALGFNVIDLGLSTTPSVEMAVPAYQADGGIILTASHNPMEWNALKLLNEKGEFISADDGKAFLEMIGTDAIQYAPIEKMGKYRQASGYIKEHIDSILDLPTVNTELIRKQNFSVIIDAVNSTGAIAIPPLLERLGVSYEVINGDISGHFAHNPEPLPAHLTELCEKVRASDADMGIAVDPDVDRLAFVAEDGSWFGEEYTLVLVSDYLLRKTPGPTVSNLSSSRALRDLAASHGQEYYAAAVGEVNVVTKMKEVGAVIGGEGNGGIIYPQLHYGRDALVGIALALSHLAETGKSLSELRRSFPQYEMYKGKVQLTPDTPTDEILEKMADHFSNEQLDRTDGVKIDLEDSWIHLRKSNTEPIIRIYTEASSYARAEELGGEVRKIIESLV